jgi:hypothetical protein
MTWDVLLLAAVVGVAVQLIVRGPLGIVVAVLSGVATFAVPIIYREYFGPPVSGGASMWPLLIVFYGPISGLVAAVAAVIVGVLRGDFRSLKRNGP